MARIDLFTDLILITKECITDETARTQYFTEVLGAFKEANLLGMLDSALRDLDAAFANAYDRIK